MADLTQNVACDFLYDIPYRNKESAMLPEGMAVCYKFDSSVHHGNWKVLCIHIISVQIKYFQCYNLKQYRKINFKNFQGSEKNSLLQLLLYSEVSSYNSPCSQNSYSTWKDERKGMGVPMIYALTVLFRPS